MWWFTTARIAITPSKGSPASSTAVGGVPAACRTDRMGALGPSQGRRFELHPPTVGFAAHHATKITSCQAGDAKRKGKVERPFRQLQETFLPEVELDGIPARSRRAEPPRPACGSTNGSIGFGLARPVSHRRTGRRSRRSSWHRCRGSGSTPTTSRAVGSTTSLPFISVDGNRYSVPPNVLGHNVEIRRPVDGTGSRFVGPAPSSPPTTSSLVTSPTCGTDDHRRASVAEALGRHDRRRDRHLRAVTDQTAEPDEKSGPVRLDLGRRLRRRHP